MTSISIWIYFVLLSSMVFVGKCSQKKGILVAFNHFLCDDFKAFGTINWWYDWHLRPFYKRVTRCTDLQVHDTNHVPMVRHKVRNIKHLKKPRTAQAVLGFNEPNHIHASNLTPKQAAWLWRYIEKASPAIPLVSPSAAHCGKPTCKYTREQWLDEFFRLCRNCRVDYIATHHYGCNAEGTMKLLKELYDRYHRKIWLTEFACHDFFGDPKRQLRYMIKVLPKLEMADYIYRYSWFASRLPKPSGIRAPSLLKANTSELTELGRFYVSFKNSALRIQTDHSDNVLPEQKSPMGNVLTAEVAPSGHSGMSVKRGFAVTSFLCEDFHTLGHIDWWYDWRASPFYYNRSQTNCTGLEKYDKTHVPMIWGWYPNHLHPSNISKEAKALLGFNEPNHFEQSNLTGRQAAKYWPKVETLSRGISLVSPSASPCGGLRCHGNATEWFDDFFANCKGCRIDFLATHVYDCNAGTVMSELKRLFKRYGLKIWLTEFACPHTTNPAVQLKFMKELLPKLEMADYVYRIRVGNFVKPSASLLEPNTSRLTTLGKFYVSYKLNTKAEERTLLGRLVDRLVSLYYIVVQGLNWSQSKH